MEIEERSIGTVRKLVKMMEESPKYRLGFPLRMRKEGNYKILRMRDATKDESECKYSTYRIRLDPELYRTNLNFTFEEIPN